MPVPISHPNMTQCEFEKLQSLFQSKCEKVETALEMLDDPQSRKQILKDMLRKHYTKCLTLLNNEEAEVSRLLRNAAMDSLLKAKAEVNKINRKKKDLENRNVTPEEENHIILTLEKNLEEIEFIRRNTEVQVEFIQEHFQRLIKECCYFKTLDCDPRKLKLDASGTFKPGVVILTDNPNSFHSELLLNCVEVAWSIIILGPENSAELGTQVLKDSLRGLIKRGLAKMVDKQCIELNDLPNIDGPLRLQVTLLGTTIENGLVYGNFNAATKDFETSKLLECSKFLDESVVVIPDSSRLDQSDINSLDITKRKNNMINLRRQVIQDVGSPHVPGINGTPQPFSGGEIPSRPLSTVQEVSTQLNDSLPFSIVSEAQYSTMRETSRTKLAEMLDSASASVELLESANGVHMKGEDLLTPGSLSGRRSVDEMQKSLSTDNSPSNSREIVDINHEDEGPASDRSILFAPKTTIYQELATPQVKQDQKRYQIKQGNTKVLDGVAGVAAVRAKKHNAAADLAADKLSDKSADKPVDKPTDKPANSVAGVATVEAKEHNVSSGNQSEQLLPVVKIEAGDDTRDKTVLEDSNEAELDESVFNDDVVHVEQQPDQHPLDDSRWEENVAKPHEESVRPSLDYTMWDLDKTKRVKFCLVEGTLSVDQIFPADKEAKCLLGPTFLTHLKRHQSILVVETTHNRIGVYDDSTLELRGWFPKWQSGLTYPLHILALSSGEVAVIEKGIGIVVFQFDGNHFSRSYTIKGDFRGLAESDEGDLLALELYPKTGRHCVKIFNRNNDAFQEGDCVDVTLSREFLPGMKPAPRYITYNNQKVYISDFGVARVYIIDLVSRTQVDFGFYGQGVGHFKQPLPILVDDNENILVADHNNGRFHVFSGNGQFIKKLSYKVPLHRRPYGMIRIGHYIYMTMCEGTGLVDTSKSNGVVRFLLDPTMSSEDDVTKRVDSPLDVLI